MNNRLVNILLALFLLCCLTLPLAAPVLALKTPPADLPKPPSPDPWSKWEPRSGINEPYNVWDKIDKINDTSPSGSEKIGDAFLAKKGLTPASTFTTDEEVSLLVQVSTGGQLYLFDYYYDTETNTYVIKDWLIFNVPLNKVGTYQTIQPTPPMQLPLPAGKHIYRLWFCDTSNAWTQKRIEVTLTEAKPPPPTTDDKTKLPLSSPQQPPGDSERKPPPHILDFYSYEIPITDGKSRSSKFYLYWNVSGATKITIVSDIPNSKPVEFTSELDPKQLIVTPPKKTTYTLRASNETGMSPDSSVTITPLPTSAAISWFYYALVAAILAASGASGFLLTRKRPLPPPDEEERQRRPLPAKRAKLLLPNNMELPIGVGEKWLGRIDFARALSAPELRFISRQHLLIGSVNGGFYIEDSHSDNGTRLNNAEIRGRGRQELHDGDRITVADAITISFKVMPTPSARRDM